VPVHLWDVATLRGRTLPLGRELPGGRWAGGLRGFTFSPDGRLIVGTDLGNVVRCLDVATGRDRFDSDELAGPVYGLSFTEDGQAVRAGCFDTFVRTYDVNGRLLKRQPAAKMVHFAPTGRVAVVDGSDEWYLMDPDTGRSWSRNPIGRFGLYAVDFTADGRTVAVLATAPGKPEGPQRRTLNLVETATGQLVRTLDDIGFGEIVKYTPDGRTLAFVARKHVENGGFQETIHLWEAATHRTIGPVPVAWGCRDIEFSPDGRLIAVPRRETVRRSNDGKPPPRPAAWVAFLEVASGRERLRLRLESTEFGDEIWAIRFAPNGRDVLLGVDDGTVRIWDVAAGRERYRVTGNSGSVTAVALSPDGRLLASGHGHNPRGGGGRNGTVLLWPFPPPPERAIIALPADRPARDTLWTDLGSSDAARAGDALNRLAADPAEAVGLIRERLAPVAVMEPARVARWVAELDAPRYAARSRAAAELERLGDRAEPALRKAFAGNPSAEVKAQVERLLAKLNGLVEKADTLRGIRAAEALERIDTPAARTLLADLAKGDPAARLTKEANASLERLDRRVGSRERPVD
jgi:WD40 repeat protein